MFVLMTESIWLAMILDSALGIAIVFCTVKLLRCEQVKELGHKIKETLFTLWCVAVMLLLVVWCCVIGGSNGYGVKAFWKRGGMENDK